MDEMIAKCGNHSEIRRSQPRIKVAHSAKIQSKLQVGE